jgi:hypothetical protein
MNKEHRAQISLIILAGVGAAGLIGVFFHSMRDGLTLTHATPTKQVAQSNSGASQPDAANNGAVLGASDNPQANPLDGIYVNPFGK